MLNKYCKEKLYTTSTLVEHTGHPFSVQKLYDLQALCTIIRVYRRIISVAIKVKLLNHFQFHQLQLKTNKNLCTGGIDAQHRPLFDNAATRRRWGEGGENTPVQQTICNHTDLPVGLLASQSTQRRGPTMKCQLCLLYTSPSPRD